MNNKGILYRLVQAFLNKDISTKFFCDEFTIIYTRYNIENIEENEFNIMSSKHQDFIYSKIADWCFKYSNDERELGDGWHINDEELRTYVTEEFQSL